jgi:hypothetical protein
MSPESVQRFREDDMHQNKDFKRAMIFGPDRPDIINGDLL